MYTLKKYIVSTQNTTLAGANYFMNKISRKNGHSLWLLSSTAFPGKVDGVVPVRGI